MGTTRLNVELFVHELRAADAGDATRGVLNFVSVDGAAQDAIRISGRAESL